MKEQAPPLLYFDSRTGSYWMKLADRYLLLDTAQARLHLRKAGLFSGRVDDGLNECERAFIAAQIDRHIDYAGALAGCPIGPMMTDAGFRILVTTGARLPESKRGAAENLDKYFSELFGDEQSVVALAWLKVARESLIAGDFRPGQLLVLAGPSGCGKSLFQALVTAWLGGRSAKPYRYFIGDTPFNADLASAEHLMIEDENASTDIRTRRNFGGRIKEFCVCKELSIHAKGRQALTLPTFRRITLSVNDEPENLMILPPLDVSLSDKITLLRCRPAELSSDRAKNWKALAGELPALAWRLERWSIPHALRCSRFGVKAWHHPDLLDALSDLSPEARLLNIIDQTLFEKANPTPWTGTSEALEMELRQTKFGFAVERLLYFPGAAGTYLGRLSKNGRIQKGIRSGKTHWTIATPGACTA